MTEAEFVAAVRMNSNNDSILNRLPDLALPDAWLVAGALGQTVWNVLTNRDPRYGIKDYDIIYFEPDTSLEAENHAIERARTLFSNLPAEIDLHNQARVHFWYEAKFDVPYPQLTRATDAVDRFLSRSAQVAIKRTGGRYTVYAPHGFADIAGLRVRRNPSANFREDLFEQKTRRLQTMWPELIVVND